MRIAVMGAGGVGGYFGARLALAGSAVTFIARGAHLAAMRADGLRVQSAGGDMHVAAPKVTDDPAAVGPVDIVLFGVKLWDTDAAARAIRPLVGPDTGVVSFQNGVQKDELLAAILGDSAVVGGVSYIAASIAAPGVIRHVGAMQRLIFGERDGRASTRVDTFAAACRDAGINAEASADIRRAQWEKFVFLVGMSASTATIRLPIGPIRAEPCTRALLLKAMREVVAVGQAEGVPLPDDFAENRLAFCDTLPPTMAASMLHDLENGNRLEVEWLSGDVVRRGEATGIPTPVNRFVRDILTLHAQGRPAKVA